MGFMVPFIGPMIQAGAQIGGMIAGGKIAKKRQQEAMVRSPEEAQALTGAQGIAGTAQNVAGSLLGESRPYIQGPANYYQTLLHGSRAAMQQAVAPTSALITQ